MQPCLLVSHLYPGTDPEEILLYHIQAGFWDTEPGGKTARLTTRAYVMQERIMSSIVLHFNTKQMFWECTITPTYPVKYSQNLSLSGQNRIGAMKI